MNSATRTAAQSTSQPLGSLLGDRFATLRFPPYFHSILATSPLGSLSELWGRLDASGRRELETFEQGFREAHRQELLANSAEAVQIYQELLQRHPRFRIILEERLTAMGLPRSEAGDTEAHA